LARLNFKTYTFSFRDRLRSGPEFFYFVFQGDNNMNENKSGRAVIITAVITAAVFVLSAAFIVFHKKNADHPVAYIYSDGKLADTIELDRLTDILEFRVETPDGGYNIIEAKKGMIRVREASCPDKVCVNMGYIKDSSMPVSCLPNRLIIRIEGNTDEDAPDIAVH